MGRFERFEIFQKIFKNVEVKFFKNSNPNDLTRQGCLLGPSAVSNQIKLKKNWAELYVWCPNMFEGFFRF